MTKSPRSTARAAGKQPPKVGDTIQQLRQQRQLSLEELSHMAGVSKSMLSQIERDKANPTIALVWRLANALGVEMQEILGGKGGEEPSISVLGAHATPTLKGSDERCSLKILGPIDTAGHFEWYELTIEAGGALVSQPHAPGAREHLTVLHGIFEIEAGSAKQKLKHGETARYAGDQPHAIRNIGKGPAVALLVVVNP
jgi:XRE family transcriptional regulator, regulator of sulfur utilization